MTWVTVAALLAGAVVIVWPAGGARGRLAELRVRRKAMSFAGIRRVVVAPRSPRRSAVGVAGVSVTAALVTGGPVAAVVVAAYAGLGAREWVRRTARKRVAASRVAALDGLGSLVADLRAGMAPAAVASAVGATAAASAVSGDERIARLVGAVWRLAEQTGAPAADLLDRVESDARASDRAAKAAAAQAAGAQATAMLLAGLPVGGILLGYAIGADPLQVLLRTPAGAGCALAAVALQGAGFLWAQRIISGPADRLVPAGGGVFRAGGTPVPALLADRSGR